jgi:tetratricopeptide (TPR) repeat protein/tRNA A-37 threonylcarbamoyl transferase component Bud32
MSSLEHLQNGRYAVLKKLGEGGKGIVYKARDTVLNRVVAIKMLKSAASSDESYARFIREAQAVAKLNHPNIVSIYDIGKENERQFFVIEFVDGMSLRGLMETYPEGKCDIQTVLRTAIDVCGALQFAHSHGVLHRDVKPENILTTQEGVAKLMDFGLAKMVGEPGVTKEGVIVGTVAYVAPENALGKGADQKSDLYSLGAVLYESVTGKPPFPGQDPVKIIFGHIHDYPVSPIRSNPKVPQALSDCIMKLLEKEPSRRYQSAAELLQALRSIAEDFLREAYLPAHRAVVVPSPRPVAVREVQLIDRAEELGLLREAVDKAASGQGGVFFLCGEAGIGKTRLARELGAYARLRGMHVLYGRCPALFRMDGVPPYVLWKEIIKDYMEISTPEQLYRVLGFYPAEVSVLVPELKQKLGAFPQSLSIGLGQERDRLFEAVWQFVTNISKEAPLLVVLDDLQWTDQSSLLLMHYMARGIYNRPLLIFGAYRDNEVDEQHPLTPVTTELNRDRLLSSIRLERMSFDDVSEMIKRILEQDDVPTEFLKLVHDKTKGNPFFVEEVVKSLKEEKILHREDNKWKIKEVTRIEFPKTVKSLVKTRLGRLDDECQNALTMASFIGNDFTFDALCAVTGFDEVKALETMEKTLKTGLIKERVVRGEDIYSFTDVIVRDVVHEEVSHLRHKKLHATIGSALEKTYAKKLDEHLGELAYHFLEGGEKDKALHYFLKAEEKARSMYAWDEGISYAQHALELIEEKTDNARETADVTERLGDLKGYTGKAEEGLADIEKALAIWTQLGDKKNTARLSTKVAFYSWQGLSDWEKASHHHRMALDILEKEPESVDLANLYEDIAHMLWRSGSPEALSWAHRALELARRTGAVGALAACYNDLGVLYMKSSEFEKSAEFFEKGLKAALENGFGGLALAIYNNLPQLYWMVGDFEKAIETGEKGSEFGKKTGLLHSLAWVNVTLSQGYTFIGELRKALSICEDNLEMCKRIRFEVQICGSLSGLGHCYCLLGEWEKSLRYLQESLDIARKIGEYQFLAEVTLWLGELFTEMGDYDEAKKYLQESDNIYEKAGDTSDQLRATCPSLAKLHLKTGQMEKAQELIDTICKNVTQTKDRFLVPYADMLKAMLLREQKKWDQSILLFEKSLQRYRSLNAQKWWVERYAELLYEYGLVYLERNGEGDREKAYSLLDQALAMYQKMEAQKRIENIIAKKKLLTA